MSDDLLRMMELFIGNSRSYGRYFPDSGKMLTVSAAYESRHFEEHLAGKIGLGLVPVLDNAACRFAAIDIDAHGEGDAPIDCASLSAAIAERELPLTVCRSKSGGAHLYCFFSEDVPAGRVRSVLAKWAMQLGWPGVEVFPKQSQLLTDTKGNRSLGGWINLPYFGGTRTAVEGGQDATLGFFYESACARRLTAASFNQLAAGDEHGEAPPCFQRILMQGVPKGEGIRNQALFLAAVYFKKSSPDNWRDKAYDFNNRVMDEPVSHGDAKKTIESVSRRDYAYKCQEEPCVSLCDRKTCFTRKFGVSRRDASTANLPDMCDLRKYDTNPVKWQLTVGDRQVFLTTDELMSFKQVRAAIVEALHVVPPMVKNNDWDARLSELMQAVEVIEVPDEASTSGFIRTRLLEWLQRVDFTAADGESERKMLLRGLPVIIDGADGTRLVAFRGPDFVDHLKRTRSEELKGSNLWLALKQMGVNHGRLRIDGTTVINAWNLPLSEVHDVRMAPKTPESDL